MQPGGAFFYALFSSSFPYWIRKHTIALVQTL